MGEYIFFGKVIDKYGLLVIRLVENVVLIVVICVLVKVFVLFFIVLIMFFR